jgi:hypothetical protein
MKHDIIDNNTGNIVGCISFEPRDDSLITTAKLGVLLHMIEELQDRVHVLEQELAEHTEHHC